MKKIIANAKLKTLYNLDSIFGLLEVELKKP